MSLVRLRFVFFIVLLVIISTFALAKNTDSDRKNLPTPRIHHDRYLDIPFEKNTRVTHFTQAAADTYVLAYYNFDSPTGPDPQGWTHREGYPIGIKDTFFHVADATELNGGDYGKLIVLEGTQSLWCGVAPADTGDFCSYATLPGYGNNWSQYFSSVAFPCTGDVTISFMTTYDSEPSEDFTYLQYLAKDGYWWTLEQYDWIRSGLPIKRETHVIPDSSITDSIKVRFYFRGDGAWSDEDGLWPTDGAIVIDSLVIADTTGVIDFQYFETESPGDHVTSDGDWTAHSLPTIGDFSGLFPGMTVLQEDGCVFNTSGMWGFFNGSTENYACGGHPEQLAVPRSQTQRYEWGDYIENEIWSPFIKWSQDTSGATIPSTAQKALLEFDVYRDLPINNLVFYSWKVRSFVGDCWDPWLDAKYTYYGQMKDWYHHRGHLTQHITPGAEHIQVALKVMDMCRYWCGFYGDGACHSHAPLFDNVRITRIDIPGPAWNENYAYYYVFQDNFAADGTLTGTVPIDGPNSSFNCEPTDEARVAVSSNVGIDWHIPGDELSGPAVYCHIKDVSPAKSGAVVSDDLGQHPWIATEEGWTTLQCHSPDSGNLGPNFDIGLNDDLYQPGDTVLYYFSARDVNGVTSYWAIQYGTTLSEAEIRANPMEVTCLPANALSGATDILYIDGFDGLGAQPYFESAFELLGLTHDRFDVFDPTTLTCSGPGGRVVDVVQQLASVYKTIIYNTGYLRSGGIRDGAPIALNHNSSDDFGMLFDFAAYSANRPGIYLSGDNLASMWRPSTATGAANLRINFMKFEVANSAHTTTGEPTSPLVLGLPGSLFDRGPEGIDNFIAYGGGCSAVNDFDVLRPVSGVSKTAMAYSGDSMKGAVLTQATPNAVGDTVRVALSGFSFHNIRDAEPGLPPARARHLEAILNWLGNTVGDPTGVVTPVSFENSLAQNYPNPFNPSTTIRYSLQKRGHVSLKVYSVTGALVKTLVHRMQQPRVGGYEVKWNGRNDAGNQVSSGVYFYNITINNYSHTKKMLLLK